MQIRKEDFDIVTLDDEMKADALCRDLLREYYDQLLHEGVTPEYATALAGSADYFTRDFLISIKRLNMFAQESGIVRQFAGNWYIVNTLEPNLCELERHLEGVADFYRFLLGRQLIDAEFFDKVTKECADTVYYGQRIESFWNITGGGYHAWERECSLKPGQN